MDITNCFANNYQQLFNSVYCQTTMIWIWKWFEINTGKNEIYQGLIADYFRNGNEDGLSGDGLSGDGLSGDGLSKDRISKG